MYRGLIISHQLDVDLNDVLLDYEGNSFFKKYKFGLLYVKAGQTEENDYYSNGAYCLALIAEYTYIMFLFRRYQPRSARVSGLFGPNS